MGSTSRRKRRRIKINKNNSNSKYWCHNQLKTLLQSERLVHYALGLSSFTYCSEEGAILKSYLSLHSASQNMICEVDKRDIRQKKKEQQKIPENEGRKKILPDLKYGFLQNWQFKKISCEQGKECVAG
jgi:hypothetical protein